MRRRARFCGFRGVNPPLGNFIEVEGVRMHYLERLAAARHRVIVPDRPGCGYSTRPRRKTWADAATRSVVIASSACPCGWRCGASQLRAVAEEHALLVP